MIEISHQQARRWIREHLDHRLPDEQWAALQTHLESCADCRLSHERLSGLEKGIRRSLRLNFDLFPIPHPILAQELIQSRQQQSHLKRRVVTSGLVVLAIALFALLGGFAGLQRMLIPQTGTGAGNLAEAAQAPGLFVEPTGLPTAQAGDFPAVVVYEARKDGQSSGNRQIYLLNPGSTPVDIGDEKANDSSPAWSPDGEWIAFLSDRSGKDEVYVTSLTDDKAIQLSDNPGVNWQGPLSWSADGQWIALTGVRENEGGQKWIYLVALDGSGARVLTGSRGGELPKFQPFSDKLAYLSNDGTNAGVMVSQPASGEQSLVNSWPINPLAPPTALGSAYDWSVDGQGLTFIASDPPQLASTQGRGLADPVIGSQVMALRSQDRYSSTDLKNIRSSQVAQSRWPGAFRGVTWLPNGAVIYLEDLGDMRANDKPGGMRPGGCWTIQYRPLGFNNSAPGEPQSLSNLCVEGGLDQGSLTPDGRWLVILGRLPAAEQRALYAVRLPGRGIDRQNATANATANAAATATPVPSASSAADAATTPQALNPGNFIRLADTAWTGDLPRVRPRLRRQRQNLNIYPSQVWQPRTQLAPSNLSQRPGGPSGEIIYVVPNNNMSVVVSANPDGTGGKLLLATTEEKRCPRWSPDRQWIALISKEPHQDASAGNSGVLESRMPAHKVPPDFAIPNGTAQPEAGAAEEIMVMDADGGNMRQISQSGSIPDASSSPAAVTYGCPIWSPPGAPGGPYIAATINTGQHAYLVVLPVSANTTVRPRYMDAGLLVPENSPVWAPDGHSVYLLHYASANSGPRLLKVNLPMTPSNPLSSTTLLTSASGDIVTGLVAAPDSVQMLEVEQPGASSPLFAQLRQWVPASATEAPPRPLDITVEQQSPRSGALAWLGDSRLGIILSGGPLEKYKEVLYLYELAPQKLTVIGTVDDRLSEAAWSPDGRYMIYSTESGLWGLDIQAALAGQVGPVWLSPQPVQGLDWK